MADLETIGTLVGSDIKKLRDEDQLQNEVNFNAYGLTERVDNRYLEVDTPNLLTDQIGDSVRLKDGMVDRTGMLTAIMPLVPFDPASTDELLDDKVNGVTTQTNHVKGDIVVTGNTFTADATQGTATNRYFDFNADVFGGLTINPNYENKLGVIKDADGNNHDIYRINQGRYFYLNNSTDTIAPGTVEWLGMINDTYQAIQDTTSGDLLTDTAKFQVIADVTRQDVIAISKSGYKTYKGLAYHDELVSTDDIATSQGFSKLGNGLYSDGVDDITIVGLKSCLNAGAYHPVYNSFGSDWSIPTTGGLSRRWYDSSIDHTSTYHTIKYNRGSVASGSGSISSGVTGRPDLRFYDKVYSDGYGGVIPVATYTDSCIDLDVEATKLLSSGGLERGVETIQIGNHSASTNASATNITLAKAEYGDWENFANVNRSVAMTNGEVGVVSGITDGDAHLFIANFSNTINRVIGDEAIVIRPTNHLLSNSSKLSVDVIGSPS